MNDTLLRGEGTVPWLVRAFAVLGAPAAWFAHLNVSYLLVPVSCRWQSAWPLHVATAVFLIPAIGSGLVAWALVRGVGERGSDRAADNLRLWGFGGMLLSALFSVVIVAVWASNFWIDPCA